MSDYKSMIKISYADSVDSDSAFKVDFRVKHGPCSGTIGCRKFDRLSDLVLFVNQYLI